MGCLQCKDLTLAMLMMLDGSSCMEGLLMISRMKIISAGVAFCCIRSKIPKISDITVD